ncbi:MAG: hypothetical protein WAM14_25070 [Candidatus Nitrosopolaris sp.]
MNIIKNTIHNTIFVQKELANPWNIPTPTSYTEQFVKYSIAMNKNISNAIDNNSQLILKSLDALTETLKVFNQTIDTFTEFTSNAAKTWSSFYSTQGQRFLKQ